MMKEEEQWDDGAWPETILEAEQSSFPAEFDSLFEQSTLREYSDGLPLDLLGEDNLVGGIDSMNDLFEDRPTLPRNSGAYGMPKSFSTSDLESIGRPMYPEYLAGQEEAIAEQAAFNLQQQQQRQEQQNLNSKWQPGPAAMPPPPTRQTPQQQQRARPQNQGKRRGQAQRSRQTSGSPGQGRPLHLANSQLNPVTILPRQTQSRQVVRGPMDMSSPQSPVVQAGAPAYTISPQQQQQRQVQPTLSASPRGKGPVAQPHVLPRQQPQPSQAVDQYQAHPLPALAYIKEEGMRAGYAPQQGARPTPQQQQNQPRGVAVGSPAYGQIQPRKQMPGPSYLASGPALAPIAQGVQAPASLETDLAYVGGLHLQQPRGLVMRRVQSTGDLNQIMSPLDTSGDDLRVGKYSAEERASRIRRYREKREVRNFSKKIKYACRKTLADSRPRIRGRFARNDEMAELEEQAAAEKKKDAASSSAKGEAKAQTPSTIRGS